MRLSGRRNYYAEWNRQRERDWELNRALRALRNAALFLLFGFVVLVLAFANAWTR
jgi:hypothetical protein